MPFTVTHTVAVLPFARFLPLSALAIGSMIPDLPLYFDIGVSYDTTHSAAGVFLSCLPLGFLAWLLWHALVKHAFVALTPDSVRVRVHPLASGNGRAGLRALAFALAALVLGSITHVVWDAFTHADRWGVLAIGFLNRSYAVAGYTVPGYALFQHGSSAVFLPLLAVIAARYVARLTPGTVPPGLPAIMRVSLAFVFVAGPLLAGLWQLVYRPSTLIEVTLFRFVTAGGATFVVMALVYGLTYTALTRFRRA